MVASLRALSQLVLVVTLLMLQQPRCEARRTDPKPLAERSHALAKVLELLQNLKTQLDADAKADEQMHTDFVTLTQAQITDAETEISDAEQVIKQEEAVVLQAEAFQAEKKNKMEIAADAVVKTEQALALAKQQRLTEQETNSGNLKKLQDSLDSLSLAIETVTNLFGNSEAGGSLFVQTAPQKSGADLVQATQKLRSALDAGASDLLDSKQQKLLSRLFGAAASDRTSRSGQRAKNLRSKASSAVGFLQMASSSQSSDDAALEEELDEENLLSSDPGDAGSLTNLLEEAQTQAKAEHDSTLEAEAKSTESFNKLKQDLEQELETHQTSVADLKAVIATSEEEEARAKSNALAKKRLLEATKSQVTQLKVDLSDKQKDFTARGKSRNLEVEAVGEALTILSPAAKEAADAATNATVEAENEKHTEAENENYTEEATVEAENEKHTEAENENHTEEESGGLLQVSETVESVDTQGSLSFVQTQSYREKEAQLMSKVASPGLAALLLQSQSTLGRRELLSEARSCMALDEKDVFAKVKEMIHDMLSKLREQQSGDMRKEEWCKAEKKNANDQKDSKTQKRDGLKTKMLAYDAELASLKAEVTDSKAEITKMKASLVEAAELRATQKTKAKADITMYTEDAKVVKEALVVLNRVYSEAQAKADDSGYQAKSTGTGVVAILQVSADNFDKLAQETTEQEDSAQKDYNDMKSTTEIRLATFEKDLEYKEARNVKLEGDTTRAKSDIESYDKEIQALDTYLEELEASCAVKGATFAERQQKREQQLASLKEALTYLKSKESE